MRNYILKNIRDGLDSNIGLDSTEYTDVLVEEVSNRIPERVTVNYFTGISITNAESYNREIGKSYPTIKTYNCLLSVLVKNADFDNGQDEVDKISNRIFKYFANDKGNLKGLVLTRDGVKENVIGFSIDNVVYGEAGDLKVGQMGNACLMSLSVLVEITI